MMIPFHIIVAMDAQQGIGKKGKLPWHLPGDLKHFKQMTTQTSVPYKKNAVIMGRKTWESLPEKFRPLSGRFNLVLTRNENFPLPEDVVRVKSLNQAVSAVTDSPLNKKVESAFIIGGAEVFKTVLGEGIAVEKIYLTKVLGNFDCDTFFTHFENHFALQSSSPQQTDGNITYYFCEYIRKNIPKK